MPILRRSDTYIEPVQVPQISQVRQVPVTVSATAPVATPVATPTTTVSTSPITSPIAQHSESSSCVPPLAAISADIDESLYDLAPREFRILSALLDRDLGESLSSVARRAGTSLAVVKTALSSPVFSAALTREVDNDAGSHRAAIAGQVVSIAENPLHPKQTDMIKFYFDRLDGFKINLNVSSTGADSFPWHVLSIDTRRRVLAELESAAANGTADSGFVGSLMLADSSGADDNVIDINSEDGIANRPISQSTNPSTDPPD